MDDGFLDQFPIGAINHIGLPESTLPKEVRFTPAKPCEAHAACRCCNLCECFLLLQVIQILPSDYYAQLEVAHHISCYAFSNKVRAAGSKKGSWPVKLLDSTCFPNAGQGNGG